MSASGITVRMDEGHVGLVTLEGDHDMGTAPGLQERLGGLVDAGVPAVVDLTAATFIDSTILRALLSARRRAREGGIGFAVLIGDPPAEPAVRHVFEMTQLVDVFPVVASRAEAVNVARAGTTA
jgi:anti-sigma B factor antagonist